MQRHGCLVHYDLHEPDGGGGGARLVEGARQLKFVSMSVNKEQAISEALINEILVQCDIFRSTDFTTTN
jgi:hypothetical protein